MEIFLLLCVAMAIWLIVGKAKPTPFKQPEVSPISTQALSAFEMAPSLWVNESERALFHALTQHMPPGFYVQGKVRMEDIIRVKRGLDKKARWALRGRVKSRHVDYVIIDRAGRPVLAIELDGKSHNAKNPSESDKVKTAIFEASGVPLKRILVGDDFQHIAAAIGYSLRDN